MISTPVLFLIFNRPELTEKVFQKIQDAQPKYLFVAADGPRDNKYGEKDLCEKTRAVVLENITWECEVKTLFRTENLGCRTAVSSAINWFFENVEEGIILEDDTVPDNSFFSYCQALLEKYRNHEQIMMITGDNFQDGIKRGNGSYYFSRYVHIWGWASWRRAWKHYDVEMKNFPEFKKNNGLKQIFKRETERHSWMNMFELVFQKKFDTWDFQWFFSIWSRNGYTIIPNVNLISNIGFNSEATHTKSPDDPNSKLSVGQLEKITHPLDHDINKEADDYTYYKLYKQEKTILMTKVLNKIKKVVKNPKVLSQHLRKIFDKEFRETNEEKHRLQMLPRYTKTETTLFGSKFIVPDSCSYLAGIDEIFTKENYKFPSKNPTPKILDCGSNIGLSVIYFKKLFPQAQVTAFEADPYLANILIENLKLQGLGDVKVTAKAVWTGNETLRFKQEGGFSGRVVSEELSNSYVEVPTVRLRDYLEEKIDFLKLDIEGAETEVIKDCADKLVNIENLFIEYHSMPNEEQRLPELLEILKKAGFRFQIKEAYTAPYPFIERPLMMDMELQLDIFAFRL